MALGIPLAAVLAGVVLMFTFCMWRRHKTRLKRRSRVMHPAPDEQIEIKREKNTNITNQKGNQCYSSEQQAGKESETIPLLPLSSTNKEQKPVYKRKGVANLHPERCKAITSNIETLKEKIIIQGSDLLENLVKEDVLAEGNKRFIEKEHEDNAQVGRLLDILLKKNNRTYEKFCDCLWDAKQGDVVTEYLSVPVDFFSAREKVINYIETKFKDIHMYTADGVSCPVSMDKIYVNVSWQRVSNTAGKRSRANNVGKNVQLRSHLEIFNKMQEYGDTRTTLSGVAGSGKTSFMKHIGHKWVEANKNCFSTTEESPLKIYILLVPIILRLIQPGMSFEDIIKSQIPRICYLEAVSICKAMDCLHKNILVIFDGYDELIFHRVIDPIISKDIYSDVSVIVTTRPHGVTLIRSLGSSSIEQMFYIYGFSKEQIQEYIKLFFALPGQISESGDDLMKELMEKKTYLAEMAKVPIQLEIMCVVWRTKRQLGNNILDLYNNFIDCLKLHRKNKGGKFDTTSVIDSLSKLANTWTKVGSLEKIFAYEDLKQKFSSLLQEMIQFGCLVKYHPSTHLETSFWSFSHLTLQEYFLALYIGQRPTVEKETKKQLSSVSKLERHEIVLKFLCGISPSLSNTILKSVIEDTKDRKECSRLLDLLQKLLPEYSCRNDIKLPLPRFVDIHTEETDTDARKETLSVLSCSDRWPEFRNMKHLSLRVQALKTLYECPQTVDISYVHTLELDLKVPKDQKIHFQEEKCLNHIFQSAKTINKLDIKGIEKTFPSETAHKMTPSTLKELKLQGESVIHLAREFVDHHKELSSIYIDETSDIDGSSFQELYRKLNEETDIRVIHLLIPQLDVALLAVKSTVKVKLTIKQLTNDSLVTFAKRINQINQKMPSITELHIERFCTKKEEFSGILLGRVLYFMPKLLRLTLGHHTIQTLSGFVKAINDSKTKNVSLCNLSLHEARIRGGGKVLGQLVSTFRYVHTLELYRCDIMKDDLEQLEANMQVITNVSKHTLAANYLAGGEVPMGHLLQRMPRLKLLDLSGCWFQVSTMLEAHGVNKLTNLQFLDLRCNTDEQFAVSNYLAFMPCLKALNLMYCRCKSMPALFLLTASLPPTLTHLNVCGNDFGPAVVDLTKEKKRLVHLHRLNIGTHNQKDEVEAIKEELQHLKPEMLVYFDSSERFWDMYEDALLFED